MPLFEVSPARPHELLPACRLLFGDGGADGSRERLLSAGAESGLLVARAGGRVCAAALAQSLPGALGVTCPPRGDSPEAEDAVALAACEWLRARGVKVCQAFADRGELDRMGPLERAGFRYVTRLVFMRRAVRGSDRLEASDWLDGAHYLPALREDFSATLLRTHDGTLDCPELNASRVPAELVAGFDLPERASAWHFLARADTAPVGLVLLNPVERSLELAYLGVVPEARGRGYGAKLVRHALHQARCAGFETVSLSVDVRNTPAVRLYTKLGFVEYERRGVWLATWPA